MSHNQKIAQRLHKARLRLLIASSIAAVGTLFLGLAPGVSATPQTDADNVTLTVVAYVAIIPALINALLPALIPIAIYGLLFGLLAVVGVAVKRMFETGLGHKKTG